MQTTATLNNTTITIARPAAPKAARPSSLLRTVARKWDLVGVLSLMASSAAYGVYALAHLAQL